MKLPLCLLSGLLTLAPTVSRAVERLPVEDFAREPETNRASLSPDGKRLAFLRNRGERTLLHVAEIDENKLLRLDMGDSDVYYGARKDVSSFTWVGDRRLVVNTTVWDNFYGVVAVNVDGSQRVPISGFEDNNARVKSIMAGVLTYTMSSTLHEIVHAFYDKDASILMLDRHELSPGSINRPDLVKVNTLTGSTQVEDKNPGEVAQWGVDFEGVARFGFLSHGALSGAIYRENERAPWRTVLPLANRHGSLRPLGFDAASNRVFVAALNAENRWAVFLLDPATGKLGEPVLSNAEYDIAPENPGHTAGIGLASPIFSRKKQTLVGFRFYTDAPRVKWFDKDFAGYQRAIDHAMPDTVNLLAGSSRDEQRLLWYAFSDQNPGAYFLMDVGQHKLLQLAQRASWIKPAQMAPMLAVKYAARDGLVIHGYLSVPVGHEPKGLPMVILVHGGPSARDNWGFDPLVQLLANRGYAVLQMNYRGSPGYGEELMQKARRQIGHEIQDDIEDATRWAIGAGVADPKHIAIMGGSYGGYSALFGLGHNPDLYRCGISLAGVTDWRAFYEKSDIAEYKTAKSYWLEQLGDPRENKIDLQAISPVSFADKITAPVLLIQGKKDQRVPPDQASRMITALEKAGRKPESLFIPELGHTFGNEKQRTEIFKAVTAFLEKNLGPGVE